ncbi:MAG: 30S ribosomal protein S13 [Oscillospiraceae bacterium]|jgi:small subunit ribosomal protein S13|nr:30S ribosomal protein S13 [Oscillospiraceae bacterium]
MARISGVDLPAKKRVEFGLTYIYGIGETSAKKILESTGVSPDIRCENLSEDDVARIRGCIEKNYKVEGDLRREVALNIKRFKEIRSYRGERHLKKLPANGQRTKTNARTCKGTKKTVANKKKEKK